MVRWFFIVLVVLKEVPMFVFLNSLAMALVLPLCDSQERINKLYDLRFLLSLFFRL
jgi:hypothetical protein